MFTLTISANLAKLYGIQEKRAIVIQSKKKIEGQIGKIQNIVNHWLKMTQLKELLMDPKGRFAKFQEHFVKQDKIEEWKKEPEYPEFFQTMQQFMSSEDTYERLKKEYRIISVEFAADQTSLSQPKNSQEKVVA